MGQNLEVRGAVACFLAPPHAAHLRVALDLLRPEQAIVAVVPDLRDLALVLHCEDFSRDIASHRLWLVAGATWDQELHRLFEDHDGLAAPSQFIRVSVSGDELIATMIERAQRVFSTLAAARSAQMNALRTAPAPAQEPELCVVAPTQFRLWNDVGGAMLAALGDADLVHFDPDDPACSSPIAFAKVARGCRTLLTANTSRGDLPGVVPEKTAWITWVTTPRIPSFAAAGPRDRLLLADPEAVDAAQKAGWPHERLHIACWPAVVNAASAGRSIGIIADTTALDQPKELADYSSHGLVWDFIRDELAKNPFCLNDDPNAYLADRMRRFSIADEGFPRARFIDRLIAPAYQQAIAKLLIDAQISLRLYGRGWDTIAPLASHCGGPVTTRAEFADALGSNCAIVNVWPVRWRHPCEFTGRAVISRARSREEFIRSARAALSGKMVASPPPGPALSLMSVLAHAR
jgi:hypothetical protein